MKTSKYHLHADSNRQYSTLQWSPGLLFCWFTIMLCRGIRKDLVDTDAFTRLVRVEQLAADRDWLTRLYPAAMLPTGNPALDPRPGYSTFIGSRSSYSIAGLP